MSTYYLQVVFFNGLKYESLLEMVSWIARVLLVRCIVAL
jgi:hypothetical protein